MAWLWIEDEKSRPCGRLLSVGVKAGQMFSRKVFSVSERDG
jgi:hypothetical protein